MYVITVVFSVYKKFNHEFNALMLKQAKDSLEKEEGCHQFDVSVNDGEQDLVDFFLYEIYESEASFEQHLASSHFITFSENAAHMVADKKVNAWHKIN